MEKAKFVFCVLALGEVRKVFFFFGSCLFVSVDYGNDS